MTNRKFLPFPVLKTERLLLRRLLTSDDKEIFALRSNQNVNKYLNRKPGQSIHDARDFIMMINDNIQRNDSVYWAITLNGTDKLIGTICLFNFSDDNLKAEIGYELLPDFQGKGIMHESTCLVIEFGNQHLGLKCIEAYTHCENLNSTRLLQKLNFKRHGAGEDNLMIFRLTHNG